MLTDDLPSYFLLKPMSPFVAILSADQSPILRPLAPPPLLFQPSVLIDHTPLTLLAEILGILGRRTDSSGEWQPSCTEFSWSLSGDPPMVCGAAHAPGPRGSRAFLLGASKKWNILPMLGSEPAIKPTAHSISESSGIQTLLSIGVCQYTQEIATLLALERGGRRAVGSESKESQ